MVLHTIADFMRNRSESIQFDLFCDQQYYDPI